MLLDLLDHFPILRVSVRVHTVRAVDRYDVHGSVASPWNDGRGGPVHIVSTVDEGGDTGQDRCASAAPPKQGPFGFVPYSVPASLVGYRLHAWQICGDQTVFLDEEYASLFRRTR